MLEIGAVPDTQPISQAMYFAVAWRGGQRHAVEVVAHDSLTRLERLWPVLIGAHAGGDHLPQLFSGRQRQAIRGVTVLFQLSGEGAAAGGLLLHIEHLAELRQRRHGEARPVHRRVGQRLGGVEQMPVFDEQQAVDHQRRDAGEVGIALLRVKKLIEGRAATVADAQAALALFGEGREQATVAVGHQFVGKARLLGDQIIALLQALQQQWQVSVALAFVEGAVARVDDPFASARLDLVGEACGIAAQLA